MKSDMSCSFVIDSNDFDQIGNHVNPGQRAERAFLIANL
jgi:hypothetical protein